MRYPDELIAPTALVQFQSRAVFTDGTGLLSRVSPVGGTAWTILRSKAVMYDTSQDTTSYGSGYNGNGFATFSPPQTTDATAAGPSPYAGNNTSTNTDYGAPQLLWRGLATVDRTLAASIRTRILGLPNASLVPSGVLYALTLQNAELAVQTVTTGDAGFPIGLQRYLANQGNCIQAVLAGKGWSMTLAELGKLPAGAIHTLLPEGPSSFVLSTSDSGPFVAGASYQGTVGYDQAPPADDGPIANATGSRNLATGGTVTAGAALLVVVFGMTGADDTTPGMSLEFQYNHVIEYIPGIGASGVVDTVSAPPSVMARQGITAAVHKVVAGREGSTNVAQLAPFVGQSGPSSAMALAQGIARGLPIPMGVRAGAFAGKALNDWMGGPSWVSQGFSLMN